MNNIHPIPTDKPFEPTPQDKPFELTPQDKPFELTPQDKPFEPTPQDRLFEPIPQNKPWPRKYLLDILHTALLVKAHRFADQIALAWLTFYENDLYVRLLRAKALLGDGDAKQAPTMIEKICQADPEFLEAQRLRLQTSARAAAKGDNQALGCVQVLGGMPQLDTKLVQPAPAWTQSLSAARKALSQGDFDTAQEQISLALAEEPIPALLGVTHLQSLWGQKDTPRAAIQNIAGHYQKRWPECVPIMLVLADSMMGGAKSDKAVALLHRAATNDPSGQVAKRIWGANNPYKALWPEGMQAIIDISIPAEVAAALGWNLLPSPAQPLPPYVWERGLKDEQPSEGAGPASLLSEPAQTESEPPAISEAAPGPPTEGLPNEGLPPRSGDRPEQVESSKDRPVQNAKPVPISISESSSIENKLEQARSTFRDLLDTDQPDEPETPRSVENELAQIAHRLEVPDVAHSDGRLPVYVVFSTRAGLKRKYSAQNTPAIDDAMQKLVLALRERSGWGSILVYADDPAGMAGLGLKPSPPDDPWKLKLALSDLDEALKEKGAMIGALLIVGGPEVVPYHHLPNPTDDADSDVPSDNPYATRDENYFIPEWPVGRLPGGAGADPKLLIGTLRGLIKRHTEANSNQKGWLRLVLDWIINHLLPRRKDPQSFGYTAEIWQRAALSVFRTIGEPRQMITSPPVGEHNQIPEPTAQLGYFNLHGLVDAPEWYGHRDPSNYPKPGLKPIDEGPDYPIALRPQDVVNSGRAPQVVFSEACYGAHLLGRAVEDSLALKFLGSGSQAVVGSTVIAYGSVTTPLNAADLLGKAFWQFLQQGFPAGEALRRAKIHLAKEMHKRQGYLDGEDQKTLISFVLYGDPLANAKNFPSLGEFGSFKRKSKEVQRFADAPPQVKTICDRADSTEKSQPIPEDVLGNVKRLVEQYLPGMEGADLSLSYEHAECCCEGHTCPTGQLGAKSLPAVDPQRRVVTMRKETRDAYRVHPAYARLTFDQEGKIVKVAVSR